jgi:hypothetical protein
MPNLDTNLDRGHVHECYAMWLDVAPRLDAKKDMYLRDIGLRTQNMITVIGSIINIIGVTYMTISCAQESLFIMTMNI